MDFLLILKIANLNIKKMVIVGIKALLDRFTYVIECSVVQCYKLRTEKGVSNL